MKRSDKKKLKKDPKFLEKKSLDNKAAIAINEIDIELETEKDRYFRALELLKQIPISFHWVPNRTMHRIRFWIYLERWAKLSATRGN